MRRHLGVLAALALAGCAQPSPPNPKPAPHYVVGDAYRLGDVWQYPQASFTADQTGLATIAPDRRGLTANGEAFDATALAASHRRLQLPAIVRVTNLENGRQILVRLNDRGPAAPGRLISLTRRAAELLQASEGTRIRMQVEEAESRQLAAELAGDGPRLALTAAPRAQMGSDIGTESLAPPSGTQASNRGRTAQSAARTVAAPSAAVSVPQRLPEEVRLVYATPGSLYIDLGSFGGLSYANILASRHAGLGARVTTSYTAPRDRAYRVQIGPLGSVAEADRMLDRALAAGVNDAAIVVE